MIKEIKFKSIDGGHSDFDAANGEILPPTNLQICADGTLKLPYQTIPISTVPTGFTAIATHSTHGQTRMILASAIDTQEGNTSVWLYTLSTSALTPIKICEAAGIMSIDEITHAATMGEYIILSTTKSLIYLIWNGQKYIKETRNGMPMVEFCIQKAGHLLWSTSVTAKNADELPISVLREYTQAVDSQITGKGYFHTPFFIRYALRMTDGTYTTTPPALILPNVLPPQLGVNITSKEDDNVQAATDFSKICYHQLFYKITSMENAQDAVAIDVFISDSIPTFDIEKTRQSHIGAYSEAIDTLSGGGTIRGRNPKVKTETGIKIFEGHYSDTAYIQSNHYLTDSDLKQTVIVAAPNNHLYDNLSSVTDYHLLTSIELSKASVMEEFAPLQCATTDFTELATSPTLSENSIAPDRIIPSAISVIDGHLLVGVKSLRLPSPMPIAICAKSGNKTIETIIKVYLRIGSSIKCVTSTRHDTSVAEEFPRYLAYPDRRAIFLSILQGGITYGVPLSPHPHLNISQWIGNLRYFNSLPISSEQDLPMPTNDTDTIDSTPCLLVSAHSRPMSIHPEDLLDASGALITGMCKALKPPKNGNFGCYNAYCFTMQGVWMLQYDTSLKRYVSAHQINSDICLNPDSIVATDIGIAYSTPSGIKMVDGSDTKCISSPLDSLGFDINRLPHSATILKKAEMMQDLLDHDFLYAHCQNIFIEKSSTLLVIPKDRDYSLIYTTKQNSWSVMTEDIGRAIRCSASALANGAGDSIITFAEPQYSKSTIIVTRPIKSEKNLSLETMEVLGDFTSEQISIAAYGCDHPGHWHLIASSTSHRLTTHSQRAYRMIRLCIIGSLGPDDYIYGIKISASESSTYLS